MYYGWSCYSPFGGKQTNKQTNRSVVLGGYFKNVSHLLGRGSINQGCRRRLVRTRACLCSAGFAYFSNDQFSKLILILQKMLLGFTQLVAIRELCWGDHLSICFFFLYSQLSSLGRCWIATLPIAFNFHCRCCTFARGMIYMFRPVVSRSVFIKAVSGVGWVEQGCVFKPFFVLKAPFAEQLTHESSMVSYSQRNPIEENRPAWMRVRDSSTPFSYG